MDAKEETFSSLHQLTSALVELADSATQENTFRRGNKKIHSERKRTPEEHEGQQVKYEDKPSDEPAREAKFDPERIEMGRKQIREEYERRWVKHRESVDETELSTSEKPYEEILMQEERRPSKLTSADIAGMQKVPVHMRLLAPK